MASSRPPKLFSSLLLLLTYAAFVSLGLPDGITGTAWPQIRADFQLSLNANWYLYLAGLAGGLISGISAGAILNRISVGRLLLLTTLLTAGAILGCGLSPWYALMIGMAFLLGLGNGAIDAGLNHYVATHLSSRHMNWLHACWGVGVSLGTLIISGVAALGGGWRAACLCIGGLQLLLAGAFLLTLDRWNEPAQAKVNRPSTQSEDTPKASPVSATSRATLRLPAAWLNLTAFFLYCSVEFSTGIWTTSLLETGRGWRPESAALLVTLFWGSLTIGRFGIGFISNHFRPFQILRVAVGGVILGAGLVSLSSLFPTGQAGFMTALGLLFMGLCLAPIYPTLMHDTPACVSPEHAVNLIGLQAAAANIGLTLVPGLLGTVMKHGSLEWLGPGLLLLASLLFATILVRERFKLRRT